MKKTLFNVVIILLLGTLAVQANGFYNGVDQGKRNTDSNEVEINFDTSPKVKDRWLCLPENNKQFSLTLKTKNMKEFNLYRIPTGTDTYNQRKLIAQAKNLKEEQVYTTTFLYNEKSILEHIYLYGIDYNNHEINDLLFNVISPCED